MVKLLGIMQNGILYYLINELIEKGVASKTTIYRRVSDGSLVLYYQLNGAPMIQADDLTKFTKRRAKTKRAS